MCPAVEPVLNTKRRSAHSTRVRLVTAASYLFARRGVAGITLTEIASAVGLSGPAIYNHFSSKDALFIAVVQQMYDEEIDAFKRVLDPLNSVADGLSALLELVPKLYRDDGTLQLLGLTAQLEAARNPEAYQVLIDASRRRDQVAVELARRAQAAGELLPQVEVEEVGPMLMSLFYGALGYRSLLAHSPEQFFASVKALKCLLAVMQS
jgi:AcrR family transcriptional regulator